MFLIIIFDSTNLDDDILAIIISSCTQIKYLDISKCPQVCMIEICRWYSNKIFSSGELPSR